MRVLHFSSEPVCDAQLMLSAELRAIADALLPGKVRDDTSLEAVPQTRPSDVDVYLTNNRPDVVHFSMHGEPDGLWLCDAYLDKKKYKKEELTEALRGMGVKLAVLNACESEDIAEAIKDQVDVVIATTKKISDEHAIIFSEVFYRSLQVGLSIRKSYDAAMRELKEVSESAPGFYRKISRETNLDEQVLLVVDRSESPTAPPKTPASPQQKMRGAAARLEAVRFGAAKEAGDNKRKLLYTVVVTVLISALATFYSDNRSLPKAECRPGQEGCQAQPERADGALAPAPDSQEPAASGNEASNETGSESDEEGVRTWMVGAIHWLVKTFSWFQLNVWLLFVFFAAPPALYLVEYFWLKRPLRDAERAALGLALKAPDSVDPDQIVDRVEALVKEMDESNKAIFDVIRGGDK